jgi:hypothetical protein
MVAYSGGGGVRWGGGGRGWGGEEIVASAVHTSGQEVKPSLGMSPYFLTFMEPTKN